jgi:hypothetical protein
MTSPLREIAETYHYASWGSQRDAAGRPYADFDAYVRDRLPDKSNRTEGLYKQVVRVLIDPLWVDDEPPPVAIKDMNLLGVDGARQVVDQAAAVLTTVTDRDQRARELRAIIDRVIASRRGPAARPGRR